MVNSSTPERGAAPAAPQYSVSASSTLTDDYIYTADVLVDLQSTSPIGVFRSGGSPNALFARADGTLCYLYPAPGVSAAGWAVSEIANTSGVTAVAAGLDPQQVPHGFYTDSENLYHIAYSGGSWGSPDTFPAVTGLKVCRNTYTAELVAYGVNASGALQFLREDPSTGAWSATTLSGSANFTGSTPVLLFTDQACDWVLAVPGTASTGGQINFYQGSISAVESGPSTAAVPNAVAEVVLGYMMSNSALFLFTDDTNVLYTCVGDTTNVVAVPGLSVANAAAVLDAQHQLHLYSADPNGIVSVLHQTAWDSTNGPVWAPYIPLETGFQMVATDTSPSDATAFFSVDQEGVLWHHVQDSQTQLWNVGKAQMPGSQTLRVPQYRTEITVVDGNGSPAGNLALTITSSSGSAVSQGGVLYPVGPSTPVSATTNPMGKVTLSTIASSLVTPSLTISSGSTALLSGINPAGDVHDYLAGNSSTLNLGSSGALTEQFSGTVLQQTQVDGNYLAPATQSSGDGQQLAIQACSGIQQLFQVNVPGNTAAPASTAATTPAGFHLKLVNGAPEFTVFRTDAELRSFREARSLQAGFGDASSWWSDVEGFAADVWHGIETAAIALGELTVSIADKTADFVLSFGKEVQNIVGAAISGIQNIVAGVQGIFAAIGAEIDQLLDWLKMVFDWSEIVNTSQALQSALSQGFTYMQGVINDWAEPLVNGFFAKLEDDVKNAFQVVIATYETNGQQLGALVPAGSSRYAPQADSQAASSARAKAPTDDAPPSLPIPDFQTWLNNAQNNWLVEKIENFLGMQPAMPVVSGLSDAFTTLDTAFQSVKDDFAAAYDDLKNFFVNQLSDPTTLGTLGVADLLSAIQEVALAVLQFLDGIIEALLQVVSLALGAANDLLTSPIEIPFFTALWNSIGDLFGITMPDLSVTGVFCTALAIPVNIVYKIANGASAQPFPTGALPASGSASALQATAKLGDDDAAQTAIQYTAGALAGIWALMDTGLDCVPTVELPVFQLLDIVAPILVGVFTWPSGIPFTPISLDSKEDKASFANWFIGWTPVAIAVSTMVAGSMTWSSTSNVPRYIDPAGKVLLTAAGAISLVSGIVASSLGADGGEIAGNIVGPLPVLTQFLRLEFLEESSEQLTLAIKLIVDFFAGEGLAASILCS